MSAKQVSLLAEIVTTFLECKNQQRHYGWTIMGEGGYSHCHGPEEDTAVLTRFHNLEIGYQSHRVYLSHANRVNMPLNKLFGLLIQLVMPVFINKVYHTL